jgi:hypothetical protein
MTFALPQAITTGVLLIACSLCACIGGQTGDDTGSADVNVEPTSCEPGEIKVGIEQQLPAGYSPKDLLDRVAEARVPAFVWSSESALRSALQNEPRGTILPEHADDETELLLRVAYDGGPSIALLGKGCLVDFVLPVTLSIEAADGSIDREVRGLLYGRPDAVIFQADSDQQPDYDSDAVACREGPGYVHFASDGTPRGVACDDDGRALMFPAACGGFAQTPLDERSTPELPVPSDMLSELSGQYETDDSGEEPIAIEVAVSAQSDLACHDRDGAGGLSWVVPVSARFEWIDADIAFDMAASLVARQAVEIGGEGPLEVSARGCSDLEGETLDFFNDLVGAQQVEASLCFFTRRTEDGVVELALSVEGWERTSEGDVETNAGWVLRPIVP